MNTSTRNYAQRLTNFGRAICLVAPLLALGGCSALKEKLGMGVQLDKVPVSTMEASLWKGPGIAPGQKAALVVVFAQPDGKILRTEGKGSGTVMWKDLLVTPTIVTADQKGNISLRHDPRFSDSKVGHVTITAPSHPDLRAELDIPFRYDVAFTSNFSGSSGTDGSSGADGNDGISGSPGSIDPNNPSPGGDGTDGSDGSAGHDGGPGGDAPPVQVRVTFKSETHPMLQISVKAGSHERFYLVDTQGGSLSIKADGGLGGSGGRGGHGGRGGSGGSGIPDGRNGREGLSGHDGFPGSQGRGGRITVTYDPQAKPYLALIHTSSRNGPSPDFVESPVPPLW
jgi:hypothetical protein